MVSPGKLQLLAELADGTLDAYEPTLEGEAGVLRYRGADRFLHDHDDPAADELEELAYGGLLTKTFQKKVYLCPECGSDKLTFTTACPSCGSLHVVETDVIYHTECEHGTPIDQVARDGDIDSYVCPGCDAAVNSPHDPGSGHEEIKTGQQHVCRDCDERIETPDPKLTCTNCPFLVVSPAKAIERVLYRYTLSATGETWLKRQRSARRALVEALTDRGFETHINTIVRAETDEEFPVHVYAADDLLNCRLVATVDDQPGGDEVQSLRAAAAAVDARAVVLTTTGTVTDRAAAAARTSDIDVLSRASNGSLTREYEVTEESDATRPLLKRFTAAVTGEP